MAQPPGADEIEVSVFGRGFGEAVALHLGNGSWCLVDSFREPGSKKPVGQWYLEDVLQLDVPDVRLIVISHWDMDHIRGMADLVERFPNAKIVISGALDTKFLERVRAEASRIDNAPLWVVEFDRVLEVALASEAGAWTRASANLRLWPREGDRGTYGQCDLEITAIAPSPYVADQGVWALASAAGALRRTFDDIPGPNEASVALNVGTGTGASFLVGADLDIGADDRGGWRAVTAERTGGRLGTLFKVAHHGSPRSDHPGVWTDLLEPQPLAMVTRLQAGPNSLPAPNDVDRLRRVAGSLYVIGGLPKRARSDTREVERELHGRGAKTLAGLGHARARLPCQPVPGDQWQVVCWGSVEVFDHLAS